MNILVVDDEPHARQRLCRLIEELNSGYRVIAEAAHGEEALALCAEHTIDCVLLDIQMPGMDGLEVASHLEELDPPPAVILVTAYQEHALEAFAHKVQDYLVKPVRRERLHEALQRVRVPTRAQHAAIAAAQAGRPHRRNHIAAHYRGSLQTIPISEIIYLLADQKYVTVRHEKGDLLVDEALTALEDEFPDLFMRIHRNALVARSHLIGLDKGPEGSTLVRLRGCAERLPVSRRHLSEVRRWLRGGAVD
jgi:two-component system response regulator AlgR